MLSWSGDIHEFLSVYQKNMTDFQDQINDRLDEIERKLGDSDEDVGR